MNISRSSLPDSCFAPPELIPVGFALSLASSANKAPNYEVLPQTPPFLPKPAINTLKTMSIAIDKILAASPNTERGRPTQLSSDPKGERLAYAVSTPFE